MSAGQVLAAVSAELSDYRDRLARLQEVPFLGDGSGAPLAGEDLMQAMIGLQDLDRLSQEVAAMAVFTGKLAYSVDEPFAVDDALMATPLTSLAERLRGRMG